MTVVSIIVPVYDVAGYLDVCVRSVLAQTHEKVEIILVDDGSTDGSGDLCDGYAARDHRVHVVHRPNGGLSAARNSGLEMARGDFVMFLDGDDWCEPTTVERMLAAAIQHEADVVIAGAWVDHEDDEGSLRASEVRLPPAAIIDADQPVSPAVGRNIVGLLGYAWNKLYRRSLLVTHRLEFEAGLSLVEDIVFNRAALLVSQRTALVREAFVHYIQRSRLSLGNRRYDDLLVLRARAIEATQAILQHWRAPTIDIEAVAAAMSLTTFQGLARGLAAERSSSFARKAAQFRREVDSDHGRELLTIASSHPPTSIRDRILLELVRARRARTVMLVFVVRQPRGAAPMRTPRDCLGECHPAGSGTLGGGASAVGRGVPALPPRGTSADSSRPRSTAGPRPDSRR